MFSAKTDQMSEFGAHRMNTDDDIGKKSLQTKDRQGKRDV